MHDNSRLLFLKYALPYFRPGMRVLEVGGVTGDSVFRKLAGAGLVWETVDIRPLPGVTHVAAGEYRYPVADGAYDAVVACQVLEHVRHPWRWFGELARVLAPGGHLVTISPVSWPYHAVPVDCWRAFPAGLEALCEEAGLEVRVCTFESLEASRYRRTIPGRGRMAERPQSVRDYARHRFLSFAGFRVEVAWDALLIAAKPPPRG